MNKVSVLLSKEEVYDINKRRLKRKVGRPRKNEISTNVLQNPRDVVDYIIKNYPETGIQKYRNEILEFYDCRETWEQQDYILDKIEHLGVPYYYDEYGKVFNSNVELVGTYENGKIEFI